MPGGDRTGPMGAGSRTGRAAGHCGGFGMPGYMNPWLGRGLGRGGGWERGRGAGAGGFGRGGGGGGFGRGGGGGLGRGWGGAWGWGQGAPLAARAEGSDAATETWMEADPQAESKILRNQARVLQSELERIRSRLDALESEKGEQDGKPEARRFDA